MKYTATIYFLDGETITINYHDSVFLTSNADCLRFEDSRGYAILRVNMNYVKYIKQENK